MSDEADFPSVLDSDDEWVRWIETQGDHLRIDLDIDNGFELPEEPNEQTEWFKRLTQLLSQQTVSSAQQQIRKLFLSYWFELRPEDCDELNDALCALITLLHSQLESLTFYSTTPDLFHGLQFVPTMPKLSTLDLSGLQCTNRGLNVAELLRKCPNLTKLDLNHCGLVDDDLAAIGSVSCPLLVQLNVSENDLTAHGMKSVAEVLKGCNQIREVIFGNESSNGSTCTSELFASLADKPTLERLYCYDMIADARLAPFLQKIVSLKHLLIRFACNDSDFECLCSSLREMRRLSTLFLSCKNGLSAERDRMLVDLLKSLDVLAELRFTSSQSSSFKQLSELVASSSCRLRELYFSFEGTNDLFPLVLALRYCSSLEHLCVRGMAVDEDLARALAQALRHNRTLRSLSWVESFSPQQWTVVLEGVRSSAIESLSIGVHGDLNDQMNRLLEDVANQGYLVNVSDVRPSESCKLRIELNKRMHRATRNAALMMLAVRRFRESELNFLPYDIVKLIAMSLFATRANEAWSNALDVREEQKKQKM